MNETAPKDRDIAMVFQSYALYPHMSVYDNMAFGLKIRKVAKDEIDRRVREAAKILEIEQYLDRKPKALSGGQRQRVALGRAIVRNAKVFLMDEPLSNLDAKLRVQMRAEIIKLHEQMKATTIYVTHDQTEAMTMADRIVVMKGGYIQQIGTPKEIYNNPANMFVASFVGSPAMNFVKGIVQGTNFTFGETSIALPEKFHACIKAYEGKEVVLGIRPEDLHIEGNVVDMYPNMKVNLHVEVAELTGHELIVHGISEGQKIIGKVSSNVEVSNHSNIELFVDGTKIHFFDPETELRID